MKKNIIRIKRISGLWKVAKHGSSKYLAKSTLYEAIRASSTLIPLKGREDIIGINVEVLRK